MTVNEPVTESKVEFVTESVFRFRLLHSPFRPSLLTVVKDPVTEFVFSFWLLQSLVLVKLQTFTMNDCFVRLNKVALIPSVAMT